jgi:hypothetical protein
VQTHAALYRPPHLTAIWLDVAPTNGYAHQVRWGGAMQLHMFGALFIHAQDSQEALADPTVRTSILQAMSHMRELVYATPTSRPRSGVHIDYHRYASPDAIVFDLRVIELDAQPRALVRAGLAGPDRQRLG